MTQMPHTRPGTRDGDRTRTDRSGPKAQRDARATPQRLTAPTDDPRGRALAGLPTADRRMRARGIPTAVLEGGDGPPLVLLHGAGEFAGVWRRVIPDLAATHRVIVPDLPGHGASGLGDDALDTDRGIRWLFEVVEATCEHPPTLVGHLLGGSIAARFAARHPDRLDRLVLVDTLGLGWYRPAVPFAAAMIHFVARPSERTQDRLFRRCMLDLDSLRSEMDGRMEALEAYALDRARSPELKAALNRLMPRVGVPPIPKKTLASIEVPTTLVWGRHDLQVRLRTAEAAAKRYGWPLHVIEDAADDPAVEQPEAFLKALREALG